MTRTLVTGATGRLGSVLRPRLVGAGHDVRAASRDPPGDTDADVEWIELDLADGRGIEEAVAGVDVVIHAASAPTGDTEAVDVEGTERLLDAAENAGVGNLVYTSIVGIDEIPYAYYQHKVAAEEAIEGSRVPSTIVRVTQFHAFVDELLGYVAKLPVWPLPTELQVQPVDAREVADVLVEYATTEAHGRTPPVGGPKVQTLGELARAYREARGVRRPILRVPIPGKTARAFRGGHATCPDQAVGDVAWTEWLADRYGESGSDEKSTADRIDDDAVGHSRSGRTDRI